MSFASDSGYTPETVEAILDAIRVNVNTQFGTSYTTENFVGTGFYKYFYALAQKVQENEIKTGEIFVKLQDYFSVTNESISRPVVTNPGLIARFKEDGYIAAIKKPINTDAGKLFIAIDLDGAAAGYAAKKLEVANIIKDSSVAGVVTQGDQVTALTLTNGQSFDFKFKLPNVIEPLLRLTITLSTNNQNVVGTIDDVKAKLIANIQQRYQLGRNFEPQKYFTVADAPWAASVLLEYSLNSGTTWSNAIYAANYDDKFNIKLANVTVVEV